MLFVAVVVSMERNRRHYFWIDPGSFPATSDLFYFVVPGGNFLLLPAGLMKPGAGSRRIKVKREGKKGKEMSRKEKENPQEERCGRTPGSTEHRGGGRFH